MEANIMKITNEQLLMSVPTINKLMSAELQDATTSYRLAKNARILSAELNAYQAWAKQQKDPFDVDAVLKEELEINIKLINPSNLNGAGLSPIDINNILFMLEDEDELPEAQPNEAPKEPAQGVPDLPPSDTEGVQDAK